MNEEEVKVKSFEEKRIEFLEKYGKPIRKYHETAELLKLYPRKRQYS